MRTGVSRDIAVGRFDRFDLSARIGGHNRRLSTQEVRLQEKRRKVNLANESPASHMPKMTSTEDRQADASDHAASIGGMTRGALPSLA
jgi:hypothetical protein